MTADNKMMYQLGYRDAIAGVLGETKDKTKLPDLAKWYEQSFKEQHFAHNWHVST